MTFLRSVRESFNSRGGKEVVSCYWSSTIQQLYLFHCHSEFRRRKSLNLRACWILLFRRGTLHSLIKQESLLLSIQLLWRSAQFLKCTAVHWDNKGVCSNPSAFDKLNEMMPFCVLASGPKRCWINESAIWFAGPPCSLHEIGQWQGLWPLESKVYRQFVAYMVTLAFYGWSVYYIYGQTVLHLWLVWTHHCTTETTRQ